MLLKKPKQETNITFFLKEGDVAVLDPKGGTIAFVRKGRYLKLDSKRKIFIAIDNPCILHQVLLVLTAIFHLIPKFNKEVAGKEYFLLKQIPA